MKKAAKKIVAAVVIALSLAVVMNADACTRILWVIKGQPVLTGRNMDWTEKMGTKLYAMPKGIERDGLAGHNSVKWTSKYGSVVAVVWDGAVADGVNEAGLGANLLYLAESKYGQPKPDREGIAISLWTQFYLDNFATVAEAVEATKSIDVRSIEIVHKGEKLDAPLHMSLSDAKGDSAIIEILDGKTVIHHGPQYTVMTNSPIYDDQLVLLKQYEGLGGKKPLPGTAEAEDRFARAAYYLTKLPEKPVSYQASVAGVLSVMRNAATPIGANDPDRPNVSATLWRTVIDNTNRRYYFEFTDMPNVVWIDLDKLNLKEGAPVEIFDLASDLAASGNVSSKFKPTDSVDFYKAGSTVTWTPETKKR